MRRPDEDQKPKLNDGELRGVMDEHGEYLIRLAFLYVKDWKTAEDMTQEVFIAYYRKSDQFDHRSSLKTYLAKIAVNKCRDHLRSWKNRRILFTDSFGTSPSAERPPESKTLRKDGENRLASEVLRLPLKYREAIILYYYQEFSIREIGELLRCSENTVKTRLRRAKDRLKEQLDPKEWEGFSHE